MGFGRKVAPEYHAMLHIYSWRLSNMCLAARNSSQAVDDWPNTRP